MLRDRDPLCGVTSLLWRQLDAEDLERTVGYVWAKPDFHGDCSVMIVSLAWRIDLEVCVA